MENFDDENNVHEKLPKNKVTHTISILKFIIYIYTNKMIYYLRLGMELCLAQPRAR